MARRADMSVPGPRSASRPAVGTALVLKASLAARSRRRQEARPACTRCGTLTVQNERERARGVYWCPRCQTYPWGSGGGPAGGGPDKVPPEAYSPQDAPARVKRGNSA
jgi:ribosomal protein L37AE/L43A